MEQSLTTLINKLQNNNNPKINLKLNDDSLNRKSLKFKNSSNITTPANRFELKNEFEQYIDKIEKSSSQIKESRNHADSLIKQPKRIKLKRK